MDLDLDLDLMLMLMLMGRVHAGRYKYRTVPWCKLSVLVTIVWFVG